MTRDALVDSEAGHNVYIEPRFVNFGLKGKARGGVEDTACIFASVIDSDVYKHKAWWPPAGVRPTLTIETSPGQPSVLVFLRQGHRSQAGERIGRAPTQGDEFRS